MIHSTLIIAGKEFRDGLRNRWVLAITLIFAALAVGISYFGAAATGAVGFTPVATTVVSLASLAVFLVPLIALMLAYDTVVGEREQGTLLLLLTYPMSRGTLLAGKYLGHALIIATSTVVGFGLAGLFITVLAQDIDPVELWQAFSYFILSAILLGLVFVSFAHLISVTVREKTRAAGLALVVWFVFVLIFDLALLGLLVSTGGQVGQDIFPYLLLLNPTDVFRMANLAGFEGARVHAGLTDIAAPGLFNPVLLAGILVLWAALPLALALWLFRRQGA